MTTETPNPVPAQANAAAPGSEQMSNPGQAGESQDQTFTSSDMAKMRRHSEKLQRELEQERARLSELAEAQKTEAEKDRDAAIATARKEVADSYEAKIKEQTIDARIREQLLSLGVPADLAYVVRGKGEIESIDDVPTAVQAIVDSLKLPTLNQGGQPGQPGSPRNSAPRGQYPRGGRWDRQQVSEVTAAGEFGKYKDQILSAQQRGEIV